MKTFFYFGEYILLLQKTFSKPEKRKIYWRRFIDEANAIGVESLGIVSVISVFVGAVITVNTSYQLTSGLIAKSVIGSVVSESVILELAPTITCLVLAGKVGSSIATELGSMRVSEQIDAMEVMGVNSAGYLILPKILAALFVIPLLIMIAMGLGVMGGLSVGSLTGIVSSPDFISGARSSFRTYTLIFSMIKTFTFAFIIASISSYQGYNTEGGSIEVGKASTRAVVFSSVFILLADYILAQLLL